MGALIPQTSFAAGELSPTLWGQYQNAAYQHGLRACRNFFISQHGAAVSRPGTEYVYRINNVFVGGVATRLIPFRYSDDVAYCLAFSDTTIGTAGVLYVVRDGAVVHSVASPFHDVDLTKIKYTQTGAVVYLTHPDATPQTLTYGGTDTDWTFADVTFDVPAPRFSVVSYLVEPLPSGSTKSEWHWKITQVQKFTNGTRVETSAVDITKSWDPVGDPNKLALTNTTNYYELKPGAVGTGSPDQAEIDFTSTVVTPADIGLIVEAWRIYRGRGKVFGFVGEADYSYDTTLGSNRWLDFGDNPDYTIAPPIGNNPFKVYDTDTSGGTAENTLIRTEDPTTCCFFEGRLVFGGTTERPYTLWTSATDNYLDFDERFVPVPDGSIQFTLAARKYEQIRSIVGLDSLIVFTDGGVWAVAGNGAALAADDLIRARVQTEIGASWRDPLVVGSALLYVAARGGMVHDLAFTAEGGGYAGGDVSFLAQHLFRQEIIGWTHARVPWNLVWAVREDGKLLSLQYRSGQVPGWSLHDTDGTFEDVCAIPEGDEDAVYVATKRGAYRYIERMATRVIDDVADAVCVDNAATYDGAATLTPTGWSHLEGQTVYGLADGYAVGPFTVSSGGVTLALAASKVTLGLRYVPEIETLDMAQGRNREKNIKRVFVDVEASRGLYAGQPLESGESPDDSDLAPWVQTTDAFVAIPLSSGTAEVRIGSTWNRGGRVFLRQSEATPVTVTALTREAE